MNVQEGYVLTDEQMEAKNINNRTFYITTIRDPVDRALSSYWFEGRWKQNVPSANRTDETGIDFRDWMGSHKTKTNYRRLLCWHCASNCFSRWFGTTHIDKKLGGQIFNVDKAVERLSKFHLIIRTENLLDADYASRVQSLLGAEDIPIQRNRHKPKEEQIGTKTTYEISKSDIAYLHEQNQLDKELVRRVFGTSFQVYKEGKKS